MPVKNLDKTQNDQQEAQKKLLDALNSNDEQAFANAMIQFANGIQDKILQDAKREIESQCNDNNVLSSRGAEVLTSSELKFYNEVIAAEGFDGVETLMPPTIINRVFDDLVQQHPLLAAIDFINTTSLTKWILKKGDINPAFWGKLTSTIQKKVDEGFETVDTGLYKLSAYLPVSKSMLDLGPAWLDQYVRAVLSEAMAIALEAAIIAGTGKEQPIGMLKDLGGSVVNGVYPDKSVAGTLTDLKPITFGTKIMEPLTHVRDQDGTDTNRKRLVNNVLLIVNPSDYWTKIFPATTVLNQLGNYIFGVLPLPATVIQSIAVPTGKMIAGIAKNYFLSVGSSKQIVRATEVHIIEDEDVYVTKQYANGHPKDNNSFLIFDITGLSTEIPEP